MMNFNDIIMYIGYLTIFYISLQSLYLLWTILHSYYLTSIGFVKDLRKYGKWVVVTGATDGIGKEYARQFAKQGFKVVLISRTKSKLENVAKEIEDEFHVETKIICFDFTQTVGYGDIEKVICELDIGILVNNVGMSYGKVTSFIDLDMNRVDDILHCNIFSDVHMTHMVLKGMVGRKRGAIIHVSSLVISFDAPFMNIYTPSKVFMKKMTKSLQLEYTGIVDHQLVTPGYVATNMSKLKPSFSVPSAEDYVVSAIRTIGIDDFTCAYWSHELLPYIFKLVPECVMVYFVKRHLKSRIQKSISDKKAL